MQINNKDMVWACSKTPKPQNPFQLNFIISLLLLIWIFYYLAKQIKSVCSNDLFSVDEMASLLHFVE